MKRQTQNTIKPKTGPYTILEKKLFGSCFDKNERNNLEIPSYQTNIHSEVEV